MVEGDPQQLNASTVLIFEIELCAAIYSWLRFVSHRRLVLFSDITIAVVFGELEYDLRRLSLMSLRRYVSYVPEYRY